MTISAEQAAKLLECTTPGPWNVQDFTDLDINSDPTAMDVTVSCAWPDHIAVAVMGGGYMGQHGLVQARTDARLIAAAPDLARALIASEAARKLAEERLANVKAAFRVNMLRVDPTISHEAIDAILKEIDNG